MADDNKKLVPFDVRELYKIRMVILLETTPLSNKYQQIRLTQRQFKIISDALYTMQGGVPGRTDTVSFNVRDGIITLPDDLQDFVWPKLSPPENAS